MADNITLNAGSGGSTLAADDISSVWHQRVKIQYGTDGSATDVSDTNPLPIDDAGGSLTVDNDGTFATQATLQAGTAEIGKLAAGVAEIGNVKNSGTFVVQEDGAALTSLQLLDNCVYVDDADWTDGSSSHFLTGGLYQSTPQTITDGDTGPLQVTSNGYLITSINGTVTVDGSGVTQPVSGTVTANAGTGTFTIQEAAAMDVSAATVTVDNAGTFAVQISDTSFAVADGSALGEGILVQGDDGTDRKNIHVDATTGDVQVDVTNTVTVDNGGTFAVQVDAALPEGTNAIGKLAANSGVDIGDVDVLSIAAGANLIGDVGISGARTSGGTSFFYDNDLDETKVEVKATAGQLYWFHVMNLSASKIYLQVFDLAAAGVTVGTTTPSMQFVVPTTGDTNGAGFNFSVPNGIAMGTGITIAATTDSEGSGAPGASAVSINLGYA